VYGVRLPVAFAPYSYSQFRRPAYKLAVISSRIAIE
jgi:hypothetical protein